MKPSPDTRVNVMLLASVRSQKSIVLGNHHQARLKAALECPGAAIAVTQGGEFLGMYDQAEQALKAALAFLQLAEELPEDGRAGVWSGQAVMEVWPESADQLPVDRARVLLGQARDHGLLLTAGTAAHLKPATRADLLPYRPAGVELPEEVLELPWREGASTFREKTMHVSSTRSSRQHVALRLTRRGSSVTVRADDCPFTIGRDSACAMIIGGPNVSRLHGAIVHEGGRFLLRDDSRNGSYLTTAGNEVLLRSESFPLLSDGVISPGAPLVEQTGDVILFRCLDEDPGD